MRSTQQDLAWCIQGGCNLINQNYQQTEKIMMCTYFNAKSCGSQLKRCKNSAKNVSQRGLPVPRKVVYKLMTTKDLALLGDMFSVALYKQRVSIDSVKEYLDLL